MTIDANELREAIAYLKAILPEFSERGTHRIAAERVIAGAEAYADSLPKPRDHVLVIQERATGKVSFFKNLGDELMTEEMANRRAKEWANQFPHQDYTVVRLTGKATLPPREKD